MDNNLPALVQSIRTNRRDLARLLTQIENEQGNTALAELYPYTGHAHIIGVTGAPGTGKSTLVNAMAKQYRSQGHTVAIVAVDPTSPFSGGAILGDRIRMREHAGDTGVFIRSMATRGSLGGLARTTSDIARAFDAAGYDKVLIETVGAGQSEVDVARTAHTTLVVEAPGLGDDVQAIKAGILEIADILVVNKSDRPGIENTVRALKAMLELGHRSERVTHHGRLMTVDTATATLPDENTAWQSPIMQTVASDGKGVAELVDKIADHRAYLEATGVLQARERARVDAEVTDRLQSALLNHLLQRIPAAIQQDILQQVVERAITPATAVTHLMRYLDI